MTDFDAMPRLAVFDLDGTLIDSSAVMTYAFSTAYHEVVGDGEPPLEQFMQLLGAPFPEILTRLGLAQEIDPIFRRLSSENIRRIDVHPDALEVCRRTKDSGVNVALHTGKDRTRTCAILEWLDLEPIFDGLVAGDDSPAGKPAADGVLYLCREFDVPPDATVVIGDSAFDMTAGRSAGAATIGCLWGVGTAAELLRGGADAVVADADALAEALGLLPAAAPPLGYAYEGDRTS